MPAQIEYESALPEQSQRNVAGAEPIAYNGYVSRLPKRQDGFVPRVNNAVAIDIEDPSPIAEDADSFLAGSIPISHYRQVGSVTEHGRLGRISDMPEIGSNNLFALKSIGSPSSPKSHRIISLTNISFFDSCAYIGVWLHSARLNETAQSWTGGLFALSP
jgi:hypothetical protein